MVPERKHTGLTSTGYTDLSHSPTGLKDGWARARSIDAPNGSADTVEQQLEAVYRHLLPIHNDRFENTLQHLYSIVVGPGDCVVDIGAHAGRHTFPMAKAVGASGTVFAFEPLPHLFDKLKLEIDQSPFSDVIRLSRSALSNYQGTAEFLAVGSAPGLSGLQPRTSHDGHEVARIEVQVDLLDNFVGPGQTVRFIKVDAEGADFHILQGSRRILERDRPLVVFESGRINSFPATSYGYGEQEFMDFFDSIRYVLYDIAGLKYSRGFWDRPTLNDFVAIPGESEEMFREYLLMAVLTEFAR